MEKFIEKISVSIQKRKRGLLDTTAGDASPWSILARFNGRRKTITFDACFLTEDKVDRLLICNPTYIAKKQGAKTDFRDALHLANELRTNHCEIDDSSKVIWRSPFILLIT
jgi:hypothetical protein